MKLPTIVPLVIAVAIPVILNAVYPMTRSDMIGVVAIVAVGYMLAVVGGAR